MSKWAVYKRPMAAFYITTPPPRITIPFLLTEVDFPVPVGAFDGRVFQNPLWGLKVGAVNNRLMHVFRNVPLASVYLVVPLVAEMLGCFEVHHIAAILLPHEDFR